MLFLENNKNKFLQELFRNSFNFNSNWTKSYRGEEYDAEVYLKPTYEPRWNLNCRHVIKALLTLTIVPASSGGHCRVK